ncbi:MAG: PAS domain S-box protein, partial [Pseudomonadota bacterium]
MSLDSLNKKAIALSPETFGVAFQYAPIGIALVGPRGKFLAVNEALCRLLKYTEEELLAIDFPTVTHPDDRDGDLEMARTLSAGEAPSFEMEKRYVTKAGALVWVLVTVGCIRNAKGAIEYYIAQVKDNTEERRAKEALEKATEFQRLVLEHSRDLIFVKNEACEITMANQAMLNMYPQERQDQVIGHTTVEDYPPAEARAFLANDRYALEHGHHETQETISFPDGSERTLLTSKTRFYDEAGEPFILGIARDISPIKTAEATLRRHTKLLELAEQTANLGHWRYNLEDESLHWSDEIFNIHGVSRKTYQPDVATAINYYHPDDRPHVQHVLGRTISRQEPFEFELRVIRPSNEIIHVQSRGWPELDRDGGVRAV